MRTEGMALFRQTFKQGDAAILEDTWGGLHWGRLHYTDDACELRRASRQPNVFPWPDVTFIAHDGFPVSRIDGMNDKQAAQIAKLTPTNAIRKFLDTDGVYEDFVEDCDADPADGPMYFGGGCPFVFGPFYRVALVNAGNVGPAHWGETTEEYGILRSGDGAGCMVSDLAHHFFARAI